VFGSDRLISASYPLIRDRQTDASDGWTTPREVALKSRWIAVVMFALAPVCAWGCGDSVHERLVHDGTPLKDDFRVGVESKSLQNELIRADSQAVASWSYGGASLEVMGREVEGAYGIVTYSVRLRNRSGATIYYGGAGDRFSGREGDPTRPTYTGETLDSQTSGWRDWGPGYCGNGIARTKLENGNDVLFSARAIDVVCDKSGWIRFVLHASIARDGMRSVKLISQPVRLRSR
jgi:hypothetical protein